MRQMFEYVRLNRRYPSIWANVWMRRNRCIHDSFAPQQWDPCGFRDNKWDPCGFEDFCIRNVTMHQSKAVDAKSLLSTIPLSPSSALPSPSTSEASGSTVRRWKREMSFVSIWIFAGLFRAKSALTADRLENGRLEKGNELFKYLNFRRII